MRHRAPAQLLLAAVASLTALLVASPAGAATIHGVPLEFSADGTGLTQVRPAGLPDGEFDPGTSNYANAGVCVLINLGEPLGACGNLPQNITPPAVTGSGTQGDPYKLTDTWGKFDFEVTETFTYVNGDGTINAKYAIKNVGASAQKFRTAVTANLSHAGTTLGVGSYDPGPPATLIGFNDDVGSWGGLQAGPTPWDSYEEADNTKFPGMQASQPAGFTNTVINPGLVDDWIGVAYDQYVVSGLAAGDTANVEVNWVFGYYAGLQLARSADSLQTGQTETITATSLAQGEPVTGAPVRYTVTGANPSSGTALTGPTGAAQFTLAGANAGTDTITAFVDPNGNGAYDADTETQRTTTISWTPAPVIQPPPQTGPTADQIAATLQTTVARLARLLRNKSPRLLLRTPAPHADYQALEAGTLRATLMRGTSALAKGQVTFAAAGTKRITLHPTKKGRKLLRRAKHLKATLTLAFAPPTGTPQAKAATVAMRRH